MILPEPNATLTKVQAGGFSEDYDRPAGADPTTKFSGSEGVYLRERTESTDTPAGQDVVMTRSVVARSELAVEWAQGDTLTLTYRSATVTEKVKIVERHQLGDSLPGTVRLILEDQ
jgi:hypothetical protein